MKFGIFIIFFALTTSVHALDLTTITNLEDTSNKLATSFIDAETLTKVETFIEEGMAARKKNPTFLSEESTGREDCNHCPKHVQLSGAINKVLEAMKKNPDLVKNEQVPIEINRLRFMFYQVKTRENDGSIRCNRYQDITPDLRPTKLDGDMQLMAEDAFKFPGVSSLQLMDPKKEEVMYYYHGEGDQKNIIIQAILTKDGGKFRYFYYRPTEKEKNPYNLPSMGIEPADATVKKKSYEGPKMIMTAEDKVDSKNKYELSVDPTLETKMSVVPKNLQIAKGNLSHGQMGFRLNADSSLSLKGNEANLNFQNEDGKKYIELDVVTTLTGETTTKVSVPYEVRLTSDKDPDKIKLNGRVEDQTTQQTITLALTGESTEHIRTEWKKDKVTSIQTYAVARDFDVRPGEKISVAVGRNEEKNKYVSFQAKKSIKDNLTMVLDVRMDENRRASLTYQLKARF